MCAHLGEFEWVYICMWAYDREVTCQNYVYTPSYLLQTSRAHHAYEVTLHGICFCTVEYSFLSYISPILFNDLIPHFTLLHQNQFNLEVEQTILWFFLILSFSLHSNVFYSFMPQNIYKLNKGTASSSDLFEKLSFLIFYIIPLILSSPSLLQTSCELIKHFLIFKSFLWILVF